MTGHECYCAKLVLDAADGMTYAMRALSTIQLPTEVAELRSLLMDLTIRCESPEHLRLIDLYSKYNVPQVHACAA